MPPLREHKEDIEELSHVLLREFNNQHGRSIRISREAINSLENHDFPGNVRELRNIIERASVLCQGPEMTPNEWPYEITSMFIPPTNEFNLGIKLAIAEEGFIKKALQQSNGNRAVTERLLAA